MSSTQYCSKISRLTIFYNDFYLFIMNWFLLAWCSCWYIYIYNGLFLVICMYRFDGFTSTFQDKLFKGYDMEIHNQIFYTTLCSCFLSLTGMTIPFRIQSLDIPCTIFQFSVWAWICFVFLRSNLTRQFAHGNRFCFSTSWLFLRHFVAFDSKLYWHFLISFA